MYEKSILALKLRHFGGHFEFLNFRGIKRHHTQKRLSDSCSTQNLAIETTRLKKSMVICPTLLR